MKRLNIDGLESLIESYKSIKPSAENRNEIYDYVPPCNDCKETNCKEKMQEKEERLERLQKQIEQAQEKLEKELEELENEKKCIEETKKELEERIKKIEKIEFDKSDIKRLMD